MRLNRLTLIGRLVRTPEVKAIDDKFVMNFCVVTDESYKNKVGEWVDRAEFTECSYFTTQRAIDYLLPALTKGSVVYVEGRKETRTYEKNGVNHKAVSCNISDIRPLGAGYKRGGTGGGVDGNATPPQSDPFEESAPF